MRNLLTNRAPAYFVWLTIVLLPGLASADVLVDGARIVEVGVRRTVQDQTVLWVVTAGGVGPCRSAVIIEFDAATVRSEDADRMLSIALAAYLSEKPVRIHNYDSADCKGAEYIAVHD